MSAQKTYNPKKQSRKMSPSYFRNELMDFLPYWVNDQTIVLAGIAAVVFLSFCWPRKSRKRINFYTIRDRFRSLRDVQDALKEVGVEQSQLIIGVDFTKSNEWTGNRTFGNKCLHHLSRDRYNPYQTVMDVLGRTLEVFDDDRQIPVFGFGDSATTDRTVFSFNPDGRPCLGVAECLARYTEIVRKGVVLSGPTSFRPLIDKAVQIVRETGQYHILVIIADGQVTNRQENVDAIVRASKFPLSIIMVGVGDGPWHEMENFDDNLPQRQFDNFQFVPFHSIMTKKHVENHDVEFAVAALQEIPDQYFCIKELGLLQKMK